MKGLPKNTIAWLLFCGSLAAPSAWGFETNYDRGRSILPAGDGYFL
ncbi:Uncharacterised protein [Kluyvera cryocrescens]|uniref:Uncharacterized protein n=1 Tax=Kluyvera cryocrescens TaxID=580 RepID=A0A485A4S6_KLUCR|nr:Uncharacterised protein [Kluyvera cryocrescens]